MELRESLIQAMVLKRLAERAGLPISSMGIDIVGGKPIVSLATAIELAKRQGRVSEAAEMEARLRALHARFEQRAMQRKRIVRFGRAVGAFLGHLRRKGVAL